MAIDISADLERLRVLEEEQYPVSDELQPLASIEAVLGYLIAWARAEGIPEDDVVELAARGADLGPDAVRHAAAILGKLGYRAVSDRLKQIAGRRKNLPPL
ncbi:hypothetical protein [Bradyrhizobium sp. Ash2021]|uniref:hypothetical protein n=1 Tax=Bradyrhizobium sp. Ash2021 TaxID=2954771 RepID=UPI0028154BBF|nr:hypothetical protein [Bradyrhizobium sp. Ash2021]WMT78831.1 hypothetical protein NL528_21895 [Bradyrhizobium sp. Ash2021]